MTNERKIVAMLRVRERCALREVHKMAAEKTQFDSEWLRAATTYYEAKAAADEARKMLDIY
jgi:hypothetical protein